MNSPSRRALVTICAALVLSALAVWVASASTWYRITAQVALRGPTPVSFEGAQVRPWLTAVALLALAGVAAVVATSGAARHLLGCLLVVAGGLLAVSALGDYLVSPFLTDSVDARFDNLQPGVPSDALRYQPSEVTPAPLLGMAGGLVLLVAGVLVVVLERRLPRFGSRFAAAGGRRPAPERERSWWEALDAGEDPTLSPRRPGPPGDPAADPRLDR